MKAIKNIFNKEISRWDAVKIVLIMFFMGHLTSRQDWLALAYLSLVLVTVLVGAFRK